MLLNNLAALRPGKSAKNPASSESQVSNAALAALNLEHAAFHGDWNYVLLPKQKQN
jgi:hypothetical protein